MYGLLCSPHRLWRSRAYGPAHPNTHRTADFVPYSNTPTYAHHYTNRSPDAPAPSRDSNPLPNSNARPNGYPSPGVGTLAQHA